VLRLDGLAVLEVAVERGCERRAWLGEQAEGLRVPRHAHWVAGGFRDLLAFHDRLEDLRFASGREDVPDGAAEQASDDAGGGDESPLLPQPRGDVVHDIQGDAVDVERPTDLFGHSLAMQSADNQV